MMVNLVLHRPWILCPQCRQGRKPLECANAEVCLSGFGRSIWPGMEGSMTFRTLKAALAAAAITLAGVGAAQALPTSGSIWINVPTSGANASIVPGTAPDATFSTGAINYTSSSGYDPGDFLNHPLFSNESSAFVTACGASGTGCSLNNSFVQITGTIGLNSGSNSFVVGHDDGAVMTIDTFGTVVSAPG